MFLFPRWDMLGPWKVRVYVTVFLQAHKQAVESFIITSVMLHMHDWLFGQGATLGFSRLGMDTGSGLQCNSRGPGVRARQNNDIKAILNHYHKHKFVRYELWVCVLAIKPLRSLHSLICHWKLVPDASESEEFILTAELWTGWESFQRTSMIAMSA